MMEVAKEVGSIPLIVAWHLRKTFNAKAGHTTGA